MDQLGAMRAFVRVVETGSFSATGKEMNTTQTTISKKVAALEKKVGVKLLTRSSRDHSLTSAGAQYYETCVAILSELDEAEAKARLEVSSPQGVVSVAAPIAFGRLIIAPLITQFFDLYPNIKINLLLNDKHIDLISEGVDVAIRAKELEDSSLVARHLFNAPMLTLASSSYLAKHGEPMSPEDLKNHNCLVYSRLKSPNLWHFTSKEKAMSTSVSGNFQCDNGDALLEAALAGVGLVQQPLWMVNNELSSGQLKTVLDNYSSQSLPFNAIYPRNRYTPLKVRCFVDFLKAALSEESDIKSRNKDLSSR